MDTHLEKTEKNKSIVQQKSGTSKRNKKLLYKLVLTAIMSAIAVILMMPVLEIPVPFMPPYIKFDFSDFPALFAGITAGPLWGVLVCLVKNLIHIPMGSTGGIGEIANFAIGAVYVLTASLIHLKMKRRAGLIVGGIAGSFTMAAVAYPVNYFIVYPAYIRLYFGGSVEGVVGTYKEILPWIDSLPMALLIFNTPFNIIKGLILTVVSVLAYVSLYPVLQKLEKKFN